MELIDDLFVELDETDLAQLAAEVDVDPDTKESLTTDTSALLGSTSQSAEDVMYAYAEAWRNSDSRALLPLVTEEYMRSGHGDRGEGSWTSIEVTHDDGAPIPSDEIPAEALEFAETIAGSMSELKSQTEVVSSEYVGDEFHFRLRIPAPELPDISDSNKVTFVSPSYYFVKMKKENDVWRVYSRVFDLDRTKSELPEIPH